MAFECGSFEEAWDAALPTDLRGWRIAHKDRATAWFSTPFTRYQPFVVASMDTAQNKIQLLY